MNNSITANIIADSIDKRNNRITSYVLNVPQIIVKELLRHRMFSFSSSSMRAIPFNKVLKDIRENMFVPLAFQSHHSGMQGSEYLAGKDAELAKNQWIESGLKACDEAERLYNLGATKQLCSRIIEPYGYAKILITATEFDGFFELRCPKYYDKCDGDYKKSRKDINSANEYGEYPKYFNDDLEWLQLSESQAEIHIQALAEAMWDSYKESTPKELYSGEWHIPFDNNFEPDKLMNIFYEVNKMPENGSIKEHVKNLVSYDDLCIKIATARCARISYATYDGEIDYEKDIKLHDQLLAAKHASPFEHCCRVMSDEEYYDFIKGKVIISHEEINQVCGHNRLEVAIDVDESAYGWCNNFRGFIQYRHLVNL